MLLVTYSRVVFISRLCAHFPSQKRDQEDAADGNSMVGAVAKRMGLGGGGSDAFSIGASTLPESTGPDFIEIGDIDPAASTTVGAQGAEGIEIEGPIVPSSSYAI